MLRFQNYKDVLFEITKPCGFLNLRLWVFPQGEVSYLGTTKKTYSCQGFGYQEFLIRNRASGARRKDEVSVCNTRDVAKPVPRGDVWWKQHLQDARAATWVSVNLGSWPELFTRTLFFQGAGGVSSSGHSAIGHRHTYSTSVHCVPLLQALRLMVNKANTNVPLKMSNGNTCQVTQQIIVALQTISTRKEIRGAAMLEEGLKGEVFTEVGGHSPHVAAKHFGHGWPTSRGATSVTYKIYWIWKT